MASTNRRERTFSINITPTQSERYRAAMCADGRDPQLMSMGRATVVQRNRKRAHQRGELKHKHRALD